jgi:predicted dehydrogenase
VSRVAILGLGSAGSRHARHLLSMGHEVIGWDPAVQSVPDGVRAAPSEEDAIAGAEAVIVATPSAHHAAQASAALEAGCHVLVEKPLAVDGPEATRVAELAAASPGMCAVGMNLRFLAAMVALKRLVDDGRLGRPLLAQASCGYDLRLWRPGTDYRRSYSARADLGGGIVLDGLHELDYLLWFLGPAASVVAHVDRVSDLEIDVEDVMVASIRFASGALAAVDLNFIEPAYRRGCVIVGAESTGSWRWGAEAVELRRGEDVERIAARADLDETYLAELEDFFAAANEDRPPRTSAAEGAAAVRLADAIKRSASTRCAVDLP